MSPSKANTSDLSTSATPNTSVFKDAAQSDDNDSVQFVDPIDPSNFQGPSQRKVCLSPPSTQQTLSRKYSNQSELKSQPQAIPLGSGTSHPYNFSELKRDNVPEGVCEKRYIHIKRRAAYSQHNVLFNSKQVWKIPWYNGGKCSVMKSACNLKPKDLGTLRKVHLVLIPTFSLFAIYKSLISHKFTPFVIAPDGFPPKPKVEYLYKEYSEMSLEDLIRLGNKSSSFDDQCILILHQEGGSSWSKTNWRATVDPYLIKNVYQYDRNPQFGQVYTAPDLNTSCHLAASKSVAEEIYFRLCYFHGPINSQGKESNNHVTHPMLLHVQKDQNLREQSLFENSKVFVWNVDEKIGNNKPLVSIQSQFCSACQHGLMKEMSFTEERRSGGTENPHGTSPVLHAGFSKSNCRAYAQSRCTQFGHVNATMIDTMKRLSAECRESLLQIIDMATMLCPHGHDTFSISSDDTFRLKYRSEFNAEFGVKIDLDTGQPVEGPYLSCEGFTVIIPLVLGAHRDSLNDFLKGKPPLSC